MAQNADSLDNEVDRLDRAFATALHVADDSEYVRIVAALFEKFGRLPRVEQLELQRRLDARRAQALAKLKDVVARLE
ncbi:MAG: hypothetical protein WCA22_00700 [Candidatus Binatus sp.]